MTTKIDKKRKRCLLKEGVIKSCIYAKKMSKNRINHENIMDRKKSADYYYCPANGCLALIERETLGVKEET